MRDEGVVMKKHIIKRSQKAIDQSVTYGLNSMERVYSDAHLDVGHYTFMKNMLLYIDAIDQADSFKSYIIHTGRCKELKTKEILGPGDMLVTRDREEMTTMIMLEDTTFFVHSYRSSGFNTFKSSSKSMIDLLTDLQEKDQYTKTHSDRVFALVKQMALALGYHSKQIYNIVKAAHFHDLGKVFIDDAILNKPGKLTDEEFANIEKHAVLGQEMIISHFDQEVYRIIEQHHERLDGSGYPNGLKGDRISEEARILAICDSYDAMITDRVYKKGKSQQEAFDELLELSGKWYDERLVRLFIDLNQEIGR